MQQLLYTLRQFQQLTGVGRTRVYALLKSGELAGVKVGRRTYLSVDAVQAWLEHLPKYKSADK